MINNYGRRSLGSMYNCMVIFCLIGHHYLWQDTINIIYKKIIGIIIIQKNIVLFFNKSLFPKAVCT